MPAAQATCEIRKFEKICEIIDRYDRDPQKLIPILQAVQDEYRYLPEEVLTYVATSLGLPPARVFGVATFYAHFSLEAKGKYVIRMCDGTACHVKRSMPILDAVRERLGLTGKQQTTKDMLFTVETVACLGACGLAPVMVINDEVHGLMNPDAAVALVEEIITREEASK
ncbi:MAG: NADH-quinone oxidoreductase subunit NuoE family protein [Armatimonadota bacterium]